MKLWLIIKTYKTGETAKVDGNEDYELSYLEQKLGVSREQVRRAIEAVGNKVSH